MTRFTSVLLAAAVGFAAATAPASAQIAWETPPMIGPESPSGLGFYWMRADVLPGDDEAVFATWGLPGTGGAVSLRGGVGHGVAEEDAAFGGIDIRAPIARHTDTQPFDLEWSGGVGVGVGDYALFSVPVSVSAGRSWSSGSVWFAPYLSLGATADYRYGDSDLVPDDEFEVQSSAGVGVDMAFDPGRHFIIRVAASMGDRQAIALGLMIGGAR